MGLILALSTSACTLLPGMYMGAQRPTETSAQAASTIKPIFKRISPQLIQDERKVRLTTNAVDISDLTIKPEPYKIGAGDVLSITVWGHPELSVPVGAGIAVPGYSVSADGLIQFPYAGNLKMEGLTENQARDLLANRLATIIRNPEVTLRISTFRSKHIYFDGAIKSAGMLSIDDIPLTLPSAIGRAGGISDTGDQSHISITRDGKTHVVDLPALVQRGDSPEKILLHSGDLIRVPSREERKVYVIGEVNKAGAVAMFNGRLSLNAALGEAGGVNQQFANGSLIYVIRNASDEQPLVYHLDAHSPVALALAENFELKATDVVYVDSAAMVSLNRVLGMIIPLSQEITMINRGFK